jgi:hypothetical protein
MADLEVVHCVVCDEGSTREDWQGKAGKVACDKHSAADVKKALDEIAKTDKAGK